MTLMSSLTLSQTKDNGAGSLENPNGNFPAPQDFNNLDADYGCRRITSRTTARPASSSICRSARAAST